MSRSEFPARIKAEAFKLSTGRCQECGPDSKPLAAGDIFYDHIIADAVGGGNGLDNIQVLCRTHHDSKTARHDTPAAAKVKRQAAKNIGATTATRPIAAAPLPIGKGRKEHPIKLPPRRGMFVDA